MIDRLYVARGGRTFGPFSTAQLRGLAAGGQIRLTDAVWREGASDKAVAAAKVKNLFPPDPAPAQGEGAGVPEASEPAPEPAGEASPSSSAPVVPPQSPPVPPDTPQEADEPTPISPDSPALLGTSDQPPPGERAPQDKPLRPPPEPARKRRAVALRGAVIVSQDGVVVHYRKKCTQCGFEDRCRSSMSISNGMTRAHFFCPKCRKARDVQIQGITM
jgi:uncharacterized protein DUF4339